MAHAWEVSSVDQGDTRYRVARVCINANGKYTVEQHPRTFASLEAAEKTAQKLNSVDQ
jgi:hypothetical protein